MLNSWPGLSNRPLQVISPEAPAIDRLAAWIHETVQPASPDGWTVDPRNLVVPEFKPEEYVVSIRGHERSLPNAPTFGALAEWFDKSWELWSRPPTLAGSWRDARQGLYVLDVSLRVGGLEPALALAREQGQRAIYHPATALTIPVCQPRCRAPRPQRPQTAWRVDRDPSGEVRA